VQCSASLLAICFHVEGTSEANWKAYKSERGRSASSTLSMIGGAIMVPSGLVAAVVAVWSSIGGMPGYGLMGGGMLMGMISSSAFMGGDQLQPC
jgi:hypothetical protein